MICAECGKKFNHGEPKNKKIEKTPPVSVAFCSEDCKKNYA